jgi:hypothetical protein
MTRLLIAALACIATGCGSGEQTGSGPPAGSVDLSSLPVTLEGMFVVDVAEGDVDDEGDDEYSEFNFGTLTVGSEEIPVQVSGSVLRAAGLPAEGGNVSATLGSKSDEYGHPIYEITSIRRQ